MYGSASLRLLVSFTVVTALAAGCSDDDDPVTADTATPTTVAEPTSAPTAPSSSGSAVAPAPTEPPVESSQPALASGLWDDGPCEATADAITVGTIAPIDAPGVSLGGTVDATQAAVDGFNRRGGVGGRCLELVVCDAKNDPNAELACVRDEIDNDDLVANVGSYFVANTVASFEAIDQAGLPVIGNSPTGNPAEANSPNAFDLTLGGFGTSMAMVPALHAGGHTKFAMLRADVPAAAALGQLLGPMAAALGMELVADIPVPAGATDYSQFILQAQDAGATGAILPLTDNQAIQVIRAAGDVGSELSFSVSWGTFGRQAIVDFGDVAEGLAFNSSTPPVTADQTRWPALALVLDDFAAAGEESLGADEATNSALEAWLSVYAFVKVLRDAEVTDVTRESVSAAMNAAGDVDMLGLIPPWTPTAQTDHPIFTGLSNPWAYVGRWDGDSQSFIVEDQQVDTIAALLGQVG